MNCQGTDFLERWFPNLNQRRLSSLCSLGNILLAFFGKIKVLIAAILIIFNFIIILIVLASSNLIMYDKGNTKWPAEALVMVRNMKSKIAFMASLTPQMGTSFLRMIIWLLLKVTGAAA